MVGSHLALRSLGISQSSLRRTGRRGRALGPGPRRRASVSRSIGGPGWAGVSFRQATTGESEVRRGRGQKHQLSLEITGCRSSSGNSRKCSRNWYSRMPRVSCDAASATRAGRACIGQGKWRDGREAVCRGSTFSTCSNSNSCGAVHAVGTESSMNHFALPNGIIENLISIKSPGHSARKAGSILKPSVPFCVRGAGTKLRKQINADNSIALWLRTGSSGTRLPLCLAHTQAELEEGSAVCSTSTEQVFVGSEAQACWAAVGPVSRSASRAAAL